MRRDPAASELRRAISAELIRGRRSLDRGIVLAGLIMCLISAGSWVIANQPAQEWSDLLHWQVLYVTGLSAILVSLLTGLAVHRERSARGGGTSWRSIRPRVVIPARLLVLAFSALLMNLLAFLPTLPLGWFRGWSVGPWDTLLELAFVVWAGNLATLTLSFAVAQRLGLLAGVGFGLLWQLSGTVLAESSTWWAQPWTWGIRPALPLLGTHQNGIAIEPGDPLLALSPWPCMALSLLLAVGGGVVACHQRAGAAGERSLLHGRPQGRAVNVSGRVERWIVRGVASGLRHTAIGPLMIISVCALIMIAVIYPVSYVEGFFGLLLLPVGSAMLAILAWSAMAPAWRSLAIRCPGTDALIRSLIIVLTSAVILMAMIVTAVTLLDGADGISALRMVALAIAVGVGIALLSLWLTARFHSAIALVLTGFGLVLGLVFGGSSLAGSWACVVGPYAWVSSAGDDWQRTALACVLSVGCWFPLARACRAAGRRQAALN